LIQIAANPDQPRKTFNDAELHDLSESIREKGVLQPILLRRVQGRAHAYEIVAGERRFRASQMAGLAEIPALVKTLTDENAMEIALIENVQRENLNAIEESAGYKNLMDKCGYQLSDVARLIGKSESYIRNIIRLLSLPDSVRKMVENGEISASHARTIAVANDPVALANEIIANKMSVADTETLVKKSKNVKKGREKSHNFLEDHEIRALENKITKKAGVFAKIRQKRRQSGEIVLQFSTYRQMHELIKKITTGDAK
jgi:ParB family chromosome partitioning protein